MKNYCNFMNYNNSKMSRLLIYLFYTSLIKSIYCFDGVQIRKDSNDVILYKTNKTTCENNLDKKENLNGNGFDYCGLTCESFQAKSVFHFESTKCETDSNILQESECSGYGIRNDIRTNKIQIVDKTDLIDQLHIYHKDDTQDNIKSAYRCNLQKGLCSVNYRNHSSGWQQFTFANCIGFEKSTAKIKFACEKELLDHFVGLMFKLDVTCELNEGSNISTNSCVIFKVAGTYIGNERTTLTSHGPCFVIIPPTIPSTLVPITDEPNKFKELYGWLIMGVVVFVLLIILIIMICCFCKRREDYSLSKRKQILSQQEANNADTLFRIVIPQDKEVVLKRHLNIKSVHGKKIKQNSTFVNNVFEEDENVDGGVETKNETLPYAVVEKDRIYLSPGDHKSNSHENKTLSNKETLPIKIENSIASDTDSNVNSTLAGNYEEIKDFAPSSSSQNINSEKDATTEPKNVYEEIPLKKIKIVKPKRKKFMSKIEVEENVDSSDYLSPEEVRKQKKLTDEKEKKSTPLFFWRSHALKRSKIIKENSLYKKLDKKKESSSSTSSEEEKSSFNRDVKRKSISSIGDDLDKVTFENPNINPTKHIYTNDETVVPVITISKFDKTNAFSDTSSETDSSNSITSDPVVNNSIDGHYSMPRSTHNRTKTNVINEDKSLLDEQRHFDNYDTPNNLDVDMFNSTESDMSSLHSDSEDSSDDDFKNTPPPLPKKHRPPSLYGNNDTIIDELYSKPHFPPIAAIVDDSTKTYYDIIPTIKGDRKSSIKINFRRPIPEGLELFRLPYSQFNYGLRNLKDGNSSCNGFCLLAANYFFETLELDMNELRVQIPNFLHKAEKIWNEGSIGSTTVEEADEILQRLLVATYNIALGDELFWSIDQGLGGFSSFEALHEIYDKCVNSEEKECLVFTFYPDKSCLCLFDENGTQVFIDLHIHFKSNHQDRNSALNDKECGGVVCRAEKHTSDVLLNYITSNMCLEMKAESKTGSAYPIMLSKMKINFL